VVIFHCPLRFANYLWLLAAQVCRRHYFFLDEKVIKKSTAAFLNDPLRGHSLNRANLSLRDFEQSALCPAMAEPLTFSAGPRFETLSRSLSAPDIG
jgi:hypothetical protein